MKLKGEIGYLAYKTIEFEIPDEVGKRLLKDIESDGYIMADEIPEKLYVTLREVSGEWDIRYLQNVEEK